MIPMASGAVVPSVAGATVVRAMMPSVAGTAIVRAVVAIVRSMIAIAGAMVTVAGTALIGPVAQIGAVYSAGTVIVVARTV